MRVRAERPAHLGLLLWELHVVEDPEDNPEKILPPVLLVHVTVGLHDLEHHRQAPAKTRNS